ncbi:hypothetical protein [Anaerocolumna jejuensis]|uniref:hypothetical protein n=1 Tax=Anaerocolumna jejuensis TaxID=259063 RepID=UPI003F7C7969
MIITLIIACEIGFWVFVLSGLVTRYIFKQKKLGTFILLLTPVVDIVLLIATVIDLRNGAAASSFHGLAAIYIGVSISFGRKMIHWADEQFAYHFVHGPVPSQSPKYGMEHARHERKGWYIHMRAWIIGSLLLYGMVLFVNDSDKTANLVQTIRFWGMILLIDFFISFSYTLWPRKQKNR